MKQINFKSARQETLMGPLSCR